MEKKGEFESSNLETSADVPEMVLDEDPDHIENELCQQLTESCSVSTLTHPLTPIPSLTDRTISISRNTNSLTTDDDYEDYQDTDAMNANFQRTNWTTMSFYTSTDDMISSGIFDSDIEASVNETIDSATSYTEEDSAYKWQDLSTSDVWDGDDETLVPYTPYTRRPKNPASSSEDEPRKPRKSRLFNIRRSEGSEDSYAYSSSNLEDYQSVSTLISDDTIYSVSKVTTWTYSDLDDSQDALCSSISTDGSISDNIFDDIQEDDLEILEHNTIATRYGLPYDVVECICHTESKMQRNQQVGFKLCKSGSCHKFEEEFGELNLRAIRLWHTSKRLMPFKRACRIYNYLVTKPDPKKRKEFKEADYQLKVNYPHYWVHLSEKYQTYVGSDDHQRERAGKKKVIESCRRVLNEQGFFSQHYQVRMRDFGENVKFIDDHYHIHEDFQMACSFLMKEYPSLFEHHMGKYGFGEFAVKRLYIHENRLRFIDYSKQTQESLNELEKVHSRESLEKIKKQNQA